MYNAVRKKEKMLENLKMIALVFFVGLAGIKLITLLVYLVLSTVELVQFYIDTHSRSIFRKDAQKSVKKKKIS